MAGLSSGKCKSPGCGRPVAGDDGYCCADCELAASFDDPEIVAEVQHSPECCQRLAESTWWD
ncbi:MAG: hypothetical protein KF752_17835 [Pirellulaceae bacterium]|nr:hypothetical protein [Pirellulaceae bacterium]